MVGCDWFISIHTVPARSCSHSGPLLYHSPVVFLDRRYPHFGNFNSAVLVVVVVVSVKSYVDSFLDPTGVPVRVSINKLYLVPKRIMAGLVGVLRNGGGLGTSESYIPVVLFDSLLHRSPCFPDVDFDLTSLNCCNFDLHFVPTSCFYCLGLFLNGHFVKGNHSNIVKKSVPGN